MLLLCSIAPPVLQQNIRQILSALQILRLVTNYTVYQIIKTDLWQTQIYIKKITAIVRLYIELHHLQTLLLLWKVNVTLVSILFYFFISHILFK